MKSFRVLSCLICIALILNSAQCMDRYYRHYRQQKGTVVSPQNSPLSRTFRSSPPTLSKNSEKTNKILSRSIIKLALALNCILSKFAQNKDNIVFSPLNIAQTLTTVMLGSAGETETELTNLLGTAIGRKLNNQLPMVHQLLGNFFKLVTNQTSGTALNLAGGVFVQQGFTIKQSFIDNSHAIYNNEVLNVDFNRGQEAADIINKWVSDKTNGKITDIIEPTLDSMTRAIIVGALYFNGDWEYPFLADFTKWQPFYLSADGKYGTENVQVEMMVNEAQLPYYEDRTRGFTSIGLPYKNKEIYMYIILPKLRTDVANVSACLTPQEIQSIVEKSSSNVKDVLYVIPKMKLDAKTDLRVPLEKLRIRTIFDPTRANFSNLAEGIYVNDIVHKVDLDVNEIGTTGAAATSTTLNRGGYINFRVDRPFIFFIYNNKVGSMTFWGLIRKPTPYRKAPAAESS